jgi:enterochelin esterase-like enzyme
MIGRRALLTGALGIAGCSRCGASGAAAGASPFGPPDPSATVLPPPPVIPEGGTGPRGQVITETWTFGADGRAVTIVPAWRKPDEKMPLLLAFHGRGEAMKGPDLGVVGWPKDYKLLRAIERLCAPPLTTDDFEGFVEPARLEAHNQALAARPFAGLVIVCPYSPDADWRRPKTMSEYAAYITGIVLPRAQKELPVLATPDSTGIDGVSLGGAQSLRIGLHHPELFGAVGTLQAAIDEGQVQEMTDLAKAARAKNPKLHLRLLTSKDDYFRRAINLTSKAWTAAGIEHDFEEVPGPHDYPFNRGPGALEMLLWHDRVLARRPSVQLGR